VARLAAFVVLLVACGTRPPHETPEQIEARRRAVDELEARLAAIRVTIDQEEVRGCRSLGLISQDFYATTYRDWYSGEIRQGVEFTAENALRDGALRAGADTALMPASVPAWSTAAQNFIFGLSKGDPPVESRVVGEVYVCGQRAASGGR
jgi:hypothetical protein